MQIKKSSIRKPERTIFLGGAAAIGMLLAAGMWPGAAMAATDTPAPDQATAGDVQVEQVIVTARKYAEHAQDVPIALTALDGETLRDSEHLRVEDLSQYVPSTNIVIPSPHQTNFTIRGIGSNPANDGLEQSTGIFIDGVYLGRPGMSAYDLIDINQIEVLRGPQGTLYGKNTTAGTVNISTMLPSFTAGFMGQATYGNYNYRQFQASVTGPLSDTLAGRLTAYDTQRDGTITDEFNGQKLASVAREGLRGQLLYQPTERLSVRFIAEYGFEDDSNGVTLINSLGATPAAFQKDLAAAGGSVIVDPNGTKSNDNDPTIIKTRQYAASAEVNWDMGPMTLTSITAYRNWFYYSMSDVDGSNVSVLNAGYNLHQAQFSEELRVATPADKPINVVAGLYYFQQNVSVDQFTAYGKEAAAYLSGVPDSLLPIYSAFSPSLKALLAYNNSRWDIYATPHTHSYAGFAQANWHITPDWQLTAGFRETFEDKHETVSRPNPISTTTGLASPALAYNTYPATPVSVSDAAPSGLVTLSYKFTPFVMAYATFSHGEKAGGVNASIPGPLGIDSLKVKPEVANDYEIGIKSDLFDDRLQLNVNGFYTEIDDYQATYITTPPGGGSSVVILTNVGEVRTQGVELEATAVPIAGLNLNSTISYDDAVYASYPNGPCPAEVTGQVSCNLTGKPVAGAPKWIANVGASYEHALTGNLTGFAGAEYSWRSSYYGYLDDSAYNKTGDYGIVNAHLDVRTDAGIELSIWGKNLTDKRYAAGYLSYGSLLPGLYVPFFGDPRTFGVTLADHM